MRHILVDHARRRAAAKRGGGARRVTLAEAAGTPDLAPDLLAVHEALESLAQVDPQKGRIVELRFFGGLTLHEVARVLDLSLSKVFRQWRQAKTWLHRELSEA